MRGATVSVLLFGLLGATSSCGAESGVAEGHPGSGGSAGSSGFGGSSGSGAAASGGSGGLMTDAAVDGGDKGCLPPDLLVVLDRTGTMYLDIDGNTPSSVDASRWNIAVGAVETLVGGQSANPANPVALDQTVRFGLELFPQDHPECRTTPEYLSGTNPTNPTCQSAELLVPPALGTGASIAAAIDPSGTRLCESTPIAQAIRFAANSLSAIAEAQRPQFLLLVTDGVDAQSLCSNPTSSGLPEAVIEVQRLLTAGVQTYVVALGKNFEMTASAHQTMNNFACAGGSAADPTNNCEAGGEGSVAKPGLPQALYSPASDGAGLIERMSTITAGICCNCGVPQ